LQLQTWMALGDCEAMLVRVALEPSWQEAPHAQLTIRAQTVLGAARAIMLAGNALYNTLVMREKGGRDAAGDAARAIFREASVELARYADAVASQGPEGHAPWAAASRVPRMLEQQAVHTRAEAQYEQPARARLHACARELVRELRALPDWPAGTLLFANLREMTEHEHV
jgi:multidrug resistance protein MdtO